MGDAYCFEISWFYLGFHDKNHTYRLWKNNMLMFKLKISSNILLVA